MASFNGPAANLQPNWPPAAALFQNWPATPFLPAFSMQNGLETGKRARLEAPPPGVTMSAASQGGRLFQAPENGGFGGQKANLKVQLLMGDSESKISISSTGRWQPKVWNEIVAFPGASLKKEGIVSFAASKFAEVNKLLQALAVKAGLEVDSLPLWVADLGGLSASKEVARGMSKEDAQRQVFQSYARMRAHLAPNTSILPYQLEGVITGLQRGGRLLLGDEMGLGKTVQALFLAAQYETEWPFLVITPSSLRFLWREQAIFWLSHLVGARGERVHVVKSAKDVPPASASMVIATYDVLRRHNTLKSGNYKVVLVDESHYIKEAKAQRTTNVLGLCKAALRVILLSGTPTTNRVVELYTQLVCILPNTMPPFRQFASRYAYCSIQHFHGRKVEKWSGAQRTDELFSLLRATILVRRLKKDVLEQLPPKRRATITLDAGLMDATLKKDVEKMARKICEKNMDSIEKMVKNEAFPKLFQQLGKVKIPAVLAYLEVVLARGDKFLLFAHHQVVLDAVEGYMKKNDVNTVRIDGKTPAANRLELVNKFQEDTSVRVAILGIVAAGTGLTLTEAQLVIFAELYWVPGVLFQAEDRAHRVGQRDMVTVQYLLAEGTLDNFIYKMLDSKARETSEVLDGNRTGMQASTSNQEVCQNHKITNFFSK